VAVTSSLPRGLASVGVVGPSGSRELDAGRRGDLPCAEQEAAAHLVARARPGRSPVALLRALGRLRRDERLDDTEQTLKPHCRIWEVEGHLGAAEELNAHRSADPLAFALRSGVG
jgi:hypothetical protein